jgi:hypothetical protein
VTPRHVLNPLGATVVAGVCEDICITRDEVAPFPHPSPSPHSLTHSLTQGTKRIVVDMVVSPQEIALLQSALATVSGWGLGHSKAGDSHRLSSFSYRLCLPSQSDLFRAIANLEMEPQR